jgi:hypothetical protein
VLCGLYGCATSATVNGKLLLYSHTCRVACSDVACEGTVAGMCLLALVSASRWAWGLGVCVLCHTAVDRYPTNVCFGGCPDPLSMSALD